MKFFLKFFIIGMGSYLLIFFALLLPVFLVTNDVGPFEKLISIITKK